MLPFLWWSFSTHLDVSTIDFGTNVPRRITSRLRYPTLGLPRASSNPRIHPVVEGLPARVLQLAPNTTSRSLACLATLFPFHSQSSRPHIRIRKDSADTRRFSVTVLIFRLSPAVSLSVDSLLRLPPAVPISGGIISPEHMSIFSPPDPAAPSSQ